MQGDVLRGRFSLKTEHGLASPLFFFFFDLTFSLSSTALINGWIFIFMERTRRDSNPRSPA